MDSYDETIEINMIDAFEYYDRLTEYIDKVYKTSYADSDMNDEIENMFDEFINAKDYKSAERTYDLECQKYPLSDHSTIEKYVTEDCNFRRNNRSLTNNLDHKELK